MHRVAKTQIKFDKFKTLRVGTNAEYPPFEFIDENRNITGFDMELARELATRVGVELDILNMSFDGLIPALKSGKIDVAISAMSATEKRKKVVAFIHAII
ncbi:MAG: transporter substrate-binding domain-containing protein [Campylobacter sp.]|nr:transporter substrate-binding domain-containing protein [Campylobacter sp.]